MRHSRLCRQAGLHCTYGLNATCVRCPTPYPPELEFECSAGMEERWNQTLPPQFGTA